MQTGSSHRYFLQAVTNVLYECIELRSPRTCIYGNLAGSSFYVHRFLCAKLLKNNVPHYVLVASRTQMLPHKLARLVSLAFLYQLQASVQTEDHGHDLFCVATLLSSEAFWEICSPLVCIFAGAVLFVFRICDTCRREFLRRTRSALISFDFLSHLQARFYTGSRCALSRVLCVLVLHGASQFIIDSAGAN